MRKLASRFVFAAVLTLLSTAALAQERNAAPLADGSTPTSIDRRIAIVLGYGAAVEINGSSETDLATAMVRWSRPIGTREVLGGRPWWGFEVGGFGFDQDPTAGGVGGHFVIEHRLGQTSSRVRPVLRAGLGALLSSRRVPPGETFHNFSLFAGGGLEIALSDTAWLYAGYRLHHVSNADTGVRNLGINAHSLILGLSWGSGQPAADPGAGS